MYPKYIEGRGIWYKSELNTIPKKKDTPLQPIFEAFTNAWESLILANTISTGNISIDIFVIKNLMSDEQATFDFDKIVITDTGVGFNDREYKRFENLRDDRKNFSNKGTGRIQYIHFFSRTTINSIYSDPKSKTKYKSREITLSKNEAFLAHNSIYRIDSFQDVNSNGNITTVTFSEPLDGKDKEFYTYISATDIKNDIIRHYLSKFCDNRNAIPNITINKHINSDLVETQQIISDDIPLPDKELPIEVFYSKLNDRNQIENSLQKERFELRSFVLPETELTKNAIYLASKGEIARRISLENLLSNDTIDGHRYLFLLSGEYIDNHDHDTRGNVQLISSKEFKKQDRGRLFPEEIVLLDHIEIEANKVIGAAYSEITEKTEEKKRNIDELKELFLLNSEMVETLKGKIKITDTDTDILRKVYESEAACIAKNDAELKHQAKAIELLDPTSDDYSKQLREKVSEFVTLVPLQNRTAITKYIARRRIVLELFEKILNKEIEKLRNGGRIDEDILHNLIFQQSTNNPESADLWLINEEFIYFKGFSEQRFETMQFNGKPIFDKEFTEEDKRYLNSLGEKRLSKRPDVLLFPEEGKCIIIEFKAPDVNVAEHLTQIDFYASMLRNYTIDELQIDTFYGYLIGESIEDRDVRGRVSRFEHSTHFNYWFRPSEKVIDFNGSNDGSIYTEIIKYTTLLKRSQLRNKVFIDKLEAEL